jgi:hypothetical protein
MVPQMVQMKNRASSLSAQSTQIISFFVGMPARSILAADLQASASRFAHSVLNPRNSGEHCKSLNQAGKPRSVNGLRWLTTPRNLVNRDTHEFGL